MSAQAGWYPDPGGGRGLFRFWDGNAWSAATSPNPAAPPPSLSLGAAQPRVAPSRQLGGSQPFSRAPVRQLPATGAGPTPSSGDSTGSGAGSGSGSGSGSGQAYATYQASQRRPRTPVGWWLGAAALLVVIVVLAAFVIRGLNNGGLAASPGGGQPSEDSCPAEATTFPTPTPQPNDGRVHGGPLSYPMLGSPWGPPRTDEFRVPFGIDVRTQSVTVQQDYNQHGDSWVASLLVGELQAGDGFFTPQQGSEVVVKCILGKFYGDAEVRSDVRVNQAGTVDGHQAWTVESHLSFDIPNLVTKGELLIVVIVANGPTAGLFYASIPDTVPQLVQPAREALKGLKVDG